MAACTVAGRWTSETLALLQRLTEREAERLTHVAQWCADAIQAGGMVHLFGTGHSRIAVEEMFPRYGSFPGFNPIVELSMTFHTQVVGPNGQRQAMFIERVQGLADAILANFHFKPDDVMIVFSVGGVTAVPVEMATGARRRGIKTVAVTSVEHSLASRPAHPSGQRLIDHADLVIDLGTPVGDALVTVDGLDTPVGPGSTVAAVTVVNEIKVQTAELLLQRGMNPPVITAAALVGSERSNELFEAAYDEHARRAAGALAGSGEAIGPSPDGRRPTEASGGHTTQHRGDPRQRKEEGIGP